MVLAIISLLIVVSLSILVTRIATVALSHTGLSKESTRLQARSAFTGAGFTINESEGVVNHPVRRRIILLLMLLGNAGIVTAVSSLILTFVGGGESSSLPVKIVLLVAGLLALWTLAMSQWVERRLSHLINRALKRYTRLDVQDYASLMHLAGEYRIAELQVEPGGLDRPQDPDGIAASGGRCPGTRHLAPGWDIPRGSKGSHQNPARRYLTRLRTSRRLGRGRRAAP